MSFQTHRASIVASALAICLSLLSAGCEIPPPRRVSKSEPQVAEPIGEPVPTNAEVAEEVPMSGPTLEIYGSVGDVEIIGSSETASVHAEIRVSSDANPEGILLPVPLTTGTGTTTVRIPDPGLTGSQSAVTTITSPSHFRIVVRDHAGDLVVRGFESAVEVTNDTGRVIIEDIRGNVRVVNRSEELEVSEVRGDVEVVDARGSATIGLITGSVFVEDSGGKLLVHSVTGNVSAKNSPDEPEFLNIEGDLTLFDIAHDRAKVTGVTGEIRYPRVKN